jgi:predicted nucleic acid-binding protein
MKLSDGVLDSAEELTELGFPLADAVHLAAARHFAVDVFLTVDDRLLRRARRFAGRLAVRVIDPVTLIRELGDADDR